MNSLQKPFYFVQREHWQYKQLTNQVLWLLFQSLNCIEPQILICPQIVTYMMVLLLFLLFVTSTRFLGDIDNGFSVHFPNTQGVTNRGCAISVEWMDGENHWQSTFPWLSPFVNFKNTLSHIFIMVLNQYFVLILFLNLRLQQIRKCLITTVGISETFSKKKRPKNWKPISWQSDGFGFLSFAFFFFF